MIGGKRIRRRPVSILKANFLRQAAQQRDTQVLSSEELDQRMTRAILARVPQTGEITVEDFLRFNVPRKDITPERVKRCILHACEIDPAVRTVEAFA
jgi:hypothetical protein